MIPACVVSQAASPSCASARSTSTYNQSRDIEAEMQQLIQARKNGQAPLPELKPKSAVSPCVDLTTCVHQCPCFNPAQTALR